MVERELPFSVTNRYLFVKWILTSTGTCLLIADLDSSRYKQNFKHSFVLFFRASVKKNQLVPKMRYAFQTTKMTPIISANV